jgi:hypothetical protein
MRKTEKEAKNYFQFMVDTAVLLGADEATARYLVGYHFVYQLYVRLPSSLYYKIIVTIISEPVL